MVSKGGDSVKMKSNFLRRVICWCMTLAILGIGALTAINACIRISSGKRILTQEEAAALDGVDCILVLGCLVRDGGQPSDMLADRLRRGVALYEAGAAPKLLMSGDHGREDYDEVDAMKRYAVDAGIPSEDIFMDHAGFSTYESLYRARDIFQAETVIIVSQDYHLYRALHIAKRLGLEAYGVGADYHTYWGQTTREVREVLARAKDWLVCIWKPLPTYLGDPIPITGNGEMTHDEHSNFS
jgi:vancomycin permeability regulator SanA